MTPTFLITRFYFLKGTLQRTFGQKLSYIISREEYPIGFTPRGRRPTSSGTLHYRPVPSLSPILCLQCTIARITPTVHSLSPVANVRGGLFICLLFVVYLLNIFNSHYLRSHFTFLLLNTFLSIAYFAWGGVIYPVLCLAMPGLIYIPPSD